MSNFRFDEVTAIIFIGALTIIAVTLKLFSVIVLAWQWVLAPIWVPIVVLACFIVISIIVRLFVKAFYFLLP